MENERITMMVDVNPNRILSQRTALPGANASLQFSGAKRRLGSLSGLSLQQRQVTLKNGFIFEGSVDKLLLR